MSQLLNDDDLSDPSTEFNDDLKNSDNLYELSQLWLPIHRSHFPWILLFTNGIVSLFRAVHFTDFTSDHYQIMTASDDYTCRVWDIPNATAVTTYKEHTDYTRCGVTSKLNRDLFITGEMVVFLLASLSHVECIWHFLEPIVCIFCKAEKLIYCTWGSVLLLVSLKQKEGKDLICYMLCSSFRLLWPQNETVWCQNG